MLSILCYPELNQDLSMNLQMEMRYYPQVVRMTRCEKTAGHSALLRDMSTFLGFHWATEYQVFEHQSDFFQTYYRAVVYIASDDGRRVVHSFAATGPSIDMAVQQVAYVALTVLRSDYYAFADSEYHHIPRGYLTDDVQHFTRYGHL